MKRVMFFAGVVCVLFTVIACGGGESPSSVTRRFLTALEKGNTKVMEQTATPELVQTIAMFGEKAQGLYAENGKIIKTTEEIDGDTAVVTVTFENEETETIDLVKVNGKWKVTIDK